MAIDNVVVPVAVVRRQMLSAKVVSESMALCRESSESLQNFEPFPKIRQTADTLPVRADLRFGYFRQTHMAALFALSLLYLCRGRRAVGCVAQDAVVAKGDDAGGSVEG